MRLNFISAANARMSAKTSTLSNLSNLCRSSQSNPIAANYNSSTVNFKGLDEDTAEFSKNDKKQNWFVKSILIHCYDAGPDNINDNFIIKKSENPNEKFETFTLKNECTGYPPKATFYGNEENLLKHLRKEKIEFERTLGSNNKMSVILFKKDGLTYDTYYYNSKFIYGHATKSGYFPCLTLDNSSKNLRFTFEHENKDSGVGPIFEDKAEFIFDRDFKVLAASNKHASASFKPDGTIEEFEYGN